MLALDTSVAVPLVMRSHPAHAVCVRWMGRRRAPLCGHAVAETYSVLTRLPGDAKLTPEDASRLMEAAFGEALTLRETTHSDLPRRLSRAGVAGGAVFDALVAMAALEHDAELATRDARARGTYAALGCTVTIVA